MLAVVTVNEPSAFTLVTVRPVRTLVEAVVPGVAPIEKLEALTIPLPPVSVMVVLPLVLLTATVPPGSGLDRKSVV